MTQSIVDTEIDELDAELRLAVARIARVPLLLVACDYDGTLAPIVADPNQAVPLPEAVAAVRALAALPQTTVAVISGRALRDLATLSRLPSEVHLVGSHGSEFDIGFVERLAPEVAELRARLDDALTALVKDAKGVRLERKPASIAVHTRGADRDVAASVAEAVRSGCATWPGIHVTTGKEVIELSVVATHKGTAVDALRMQLSASAVIFLGDDVTDENAFAQLHGPDVGIKIGTGETRASFTVADPHTAVRVLGLLTVARRRWLFGERAVPIERHTMLGNGNTVALLAPDARVTWLCHPRPDSPAIFADLLGDASAGYFSVGPQRHLPGADSMPLGQRYRPATMTVETRWSGLTVTDWLDHREQPGTSMIRVLTGHIRARLEFAPRPEFGQVPVQLQPIGDELHVYGSNEPIALVAPGIEWEILQENGHQTAVATVDLAAVGGTVALELRMGGRDTDQPTSPISPTSAYERQTSSELDWRVWASKLTLPKLAREQVLRSALTLRALVYQPTGAIIAAATSSLPEELGGIRNWDYRYCWLRDAAMSARVLVDMGSVDEAEALLDWTEKVLEETGGHPERLHPLYTVDGVELGPEAVIETLPGYAGSRPVRVGNAANRQVQLDVFGPIADLVDAIGRVTMKLTQSQLDLVENMVTAVERRWHEPDHGIWEARLPPRHHIYSKVMCWLTVDRAVSMVERHRLPDRPEWRQLRDKIAENVLEHGWHADAGAFTVAYGFPEMDASSLWVGLSGLLADDDPRFLATVLAIEADLRSGPIVYRYKWDDGLPGREGGFHVCSAWLIEAYLRTGRRADAEELFEQMLDCAGPTGLLPEQYDPIAERGLGNHPQAYSHLGLIRCAQLLDAQD
jgi:trehalose-phosphatase